MEIDHLKSFPSTHEEDQMEMMMLMDKLHADFFSTYNDIVTHDLSSSLEFPPPGVTTSNISTDSPVQDFIPTQNISPSPSLISFPSTVTYVNNSTPIQEDCSRPFSSNPAGMAPTARWRGVEFPGANAGCCDPAQKKNSMAAMREMIFRIAAMQPIHIDPESIKPPKRRNVKISKDPQSVAARHRRERISERIRTLQRLVPGGTKMDTASMLDEAIHYVKFLKTQVQSLERAQANKPSPSSSSSSPPSTGIGFPVAMSSGSCFPIGKPYHQQRNQNVQHYGA